MLVADACRAGASARHTSAAVSHAPANEPRAAAHRTWVRAWPNRFRAVAAAAPETQSFPVCAARTRSPRRACAEPPHCTREEPPSPALCAHRDASAARARDITSRGKRNLRAAVAVLECDYSTLQGSLVWWLLQRWGSTWRSGPGCYPACCPGCCGAVARPVECGAAGLSRRPATTWQRSRGYARWDRRTCAPLARVLCPPQARHCSRLQTARLTNHESRSRSSLSRLGLSWHQLLHFLSFLLQRSLTKQRVSEVGNREAVQSIH